MQWGSYIARVTHSGRTITKSFKLRKDADAFLALCTVNKRQGIPLPEQEPDVTMTDAIIAFKKELELEVRNKRIRASTKQFYLDCLPRIAEHFRYSSLLSITRDALNQYLASRDVSDGRKRHEYITLMRIYGVQLAGQTMLTRPLMYAKVQELKQCHKPQQTTDAVPKSLASRQISSLRDAAKKSGNVQMQMILELALQTGLRRANILGMQWRWIDWRNATITVPGEHSKNGREIVIPIANALKSLLRLYRIKQGHTIDLFSKINFRRQWERLVKESGIGDVTFHQLRHSFVVAGLEHGIDLGTMSELAGHSTIGITKDIYGKLSMGHKRAAIELMAGNEKRGSR
jgi:integrase